MVYLSRKTFITNYSQPNADTFFSFGSVQPFVPLYAVILGERAHIVMNIVCVVALWFVSLNLNGVPCLSLSLTVMIEYSDSYSGCIPPRLRRRSRWSSSLFELGCASQRWAASKCNHCCMGRVCHCHLHYLTFSCGIHLTGLNVRCSFCRGVWIDLLWASCPHAQNLSQACMEPWALEQALSICFCPVECVGCRNLVLALRIPC